MPIGAFLEEASSQPTSLYPHRAECVWLAVDRRPVLSDEDELLEFLRVAQATEWKKVGVGVNKISRDLLEQDGLRLPAAWRVVEGEVS
ncbi:MAG: hypothetical protein ACWGQW_12100, partial [bacterium]